MRCFGERITRLVPYAWKWCQRTVTLNYSHKLVQSPMNVSSMLVTNDCMWSLAVAFSPFYNFLQWLRAGDSKLYKRETNEHFNHGHDAITESLWLMYVYIGYLSKGRTFMSAAISKYRPNANCGCPCSHFHNFYKYSHQEADLSASDKTKASLLSLA